MSQTKGDIINLAKKHGLNLNADTIEVNESGVDFKVAFGTDQSGKDWALRIPRRSDVFKRTEPEKRALELIAGEVAFEVPVWEIYEQDLIAYRKLTGLPAGTIDMEIQGYVFEIDEDNVPQNFIDTMADHMVELHNISQQKAEDAGFKIVTPDDLRNNMKQRMEKVKGKFGVSDELWGRWMNWIDDDEMWPDFCGLIHGDLHPGHIMVDGDSNVTGMIDWTEAQINDISKDFMGHHRVFGDEGLERLIEAYESSGGGVWPKMKAHMIELSATYPVDIAEFALESGMEEYEEMAKQTLGVE